MTISLPRAVLLVFPLSALLLAACEASDDQAPPAAETPAAARAAEAEATSLAGEPLMRPELDAETRARLETNLAAAQADLEQNPGSADAQIWVARRLGYLGRYRDAVDVLTQGVAEHPDDARMYRHRGHRYITLRQFDKAEDDLERAAELQRSVPDEVEPDGAPNAAGIPTSTLQGNIWYHLGLARYLQGDFEEALEAYREAMRTATNDDMRVATADWLYMTLRRMGRGAEAARVLDPINAEMNILENDAYHRRLLMYKGELPPDSLLSDSGDALQMATQGYGVGNWYLYNDEPERARQIFQQVISYGNWPSFGHIAAEADLRRME